MAFCKYCGNQIEDGQECTCEGAQAAKAAATASQPQVQATVSSAPTQASVIASSVGPEMGSLLKKYFTAPLAGAEEAYASPKVIAQFIFGGIYLVLSLLLLGLKFSDVGGFKLACGITFAVIVIKAILAVVAFLTKTVEGGILNSFAAFSYTTISSTIFTILVVIASSFDSYLFFVGVIVAWIVVGTVRSSHVFHVMHKGSENKGAIIYDIVIAIVAIVAAMIITKVGSEAVMSYIEDMIYGSVYSMFGF